MSEGSGTARGLRENSWQPEQPGRGETQGRRLALIEAVIFAAEEPPTVDQLAAGLGFSEASLRADLEILAQMYRAETRGLELRAVAGGYRILTKPEHHEAIKAFGRSTQSGPRLSQPALETLAVIAYRQPITLPEIQAIRGVNATGVIQTLLRHKLVATAGRKKVIGRPMLYKTTNDFLIHFGLNDLSELPNLKEFEELSRAAIDHDLAVAQGAAEPEATEVEEDRSIRRVPNAPADSFVEPTH